MRLVIAGSRSFSDYNRAEAFINHCVAQLSPSEPLIILSGGCRGADRLGERYADKYCLCIERHLPQWQLYGKGAGPKRNRTMVDGCDAVVCFWDGKSRGTHSLITYCEQQEKPLFILNV